MALPTVIGAAGLQPQAPADILNQLITRVSAVRPGYTANLPASLIEDISSTDVYAISMIDAARVEFVNSLTPFGANVFILNQLGQMLGVQPGKTSNTSVYVVFTGPAGYLVPIGFTVSDGNFQYTVQDGGVIQTDGQSDQLFCLATVPGIWAVPPSTVTQIITSHPGVVDLTCINPDAGIPGSGTESIDSYRSRVLQANLAESQGMAGYLKTLLTNVPNVQARLVSVVQEAGGGWEVICGGGDPYAVANAIYRSLFDITLLTGSLLRVTGITAANPGVVTTDLNHNYEDGQVINIVGVVGMSGINNTPLTVTVVSPTQFSIGIDTSSSGAYVSGGIVSPNLRNVTVSLTSYPDSYTITLVNPPQQTVNMNVHWGTNAPNFVSGPAIATLAAPAITDYINAIPAGQPINVYEMQTVFQEAVSSILPAANLSTIQFFVTIDGNGAGVVAGSGIINGDPESFFFTQAPNITFTQV